MSTTLEAPEEDATGLVSVRRRVRGGRVELHIGAAIIAAVVLACVLIPFINGGDPDALVAAPLQPPSSAHLFGTDSVGRDVFIRVFAAGRLDIGLALLGVVVPFVGGTLIGTVVGATRSRVVDTVVMRVTDAVIAFPFVVVILVVVLIMGVGTRIPPLPAGGASILIAVWLVAWTFYARLARARTHVVRQEDFVEAARLLGFSRVRIVVRHLLPSVWPTTATYAVAEVMFMISLIAALPFLGAGIQPPTAEWGSMMYEGRGTLAQAWWVSLCPAGMVLVFGIGVMMVVDSLASSAHRPRMP